MNWFNLLIAIVSEVVGTSALKASDGFTKFLPSVIVVVGYGLAFYFLALTIRTVPMGIAYAVWSGLGLALIVLADWIVFGQRLDMPAFIGLALIAAGVVILNAYSKTATH